MCFQPDKLSASKTASKEETALRKVLHNGYASEQEKATAGNLPGSRVRKRMSVGECAQGKTDKRNT